MKLIVIGAQVISAQLWLTRPLNATAKSRRVTATLFCLRLIEMKRILINLYYDFLMFLENVFGGIEISINNHRKRIDDKCWCKYIAPQNNNPIQPTAKRCG